MKESGPNFSKNPEKKQKIEVFETDLDTLLSSGEDDLYKRFEGREDWKLADRFNNWWNDLCKKNGFNPESKRFGMLSYHIMELARNALQNTGNGSIKVTFNPKNVTVVVFDDGPGFDEGPLYHYASHFYGHGLYGVVEYADEFSLETHKRKYVKDKDGLEKIGSSDVKKEQE